MKKKRKKYTQEFKDEAARADLANIISDGVAPTPGIGSIVPGLILLLLKE